jgi:hypothetical protein
MVELIVLADHNARGEQEREGRSIPGDYLSAHAEYLS